MGPLPCNLWVGLLFKEFLGWLIWHNFYLDSRLCF
uniref:Uncharacterized protein n=1 Tax=Rhizophora mucronata TaxID=61149 RepID=A0A2P2J465_RHIMU